jgi:mannosyltransferase OCH1-like enzyme
MAIVSDAVRFVVLHKFGGMYIDADILLLHDLQPFYMYEFAYLWSTLNENRI